MQMPQMPQPAYYIFKCEQSAPPGMPKPSCVTEESQGLFMHIAQSLMQKGLMGPVQLIKTSCLGRCQQGPVMLVVGGDQKWMYTGLNEEKIDRILDEHLKGGNPVEEYLIDEQFWGEPLPIKA
ncbi:MAG TPA: (2Fe-2S) ferredoxin domain-containing protein [Arcobacter sp.]|jgi:(2Fe-2S) ferredoxin|nr:(2Fe-2S) ferredoxin domain-containing protein [Arcobacter sp.]